MPQDHSSVAERACQTWQNRPDALIEILHDVQHELGHVSDDAARHIAACLNLSRADVHGVRSFYSDFCREPGGKPKVKLCRAEACQSVGSDALAKSLAARGIETETIYCLGNCALGPAAMVGDMPIGRADADQIATRLAEAEND